METKSSEPEITQKQFCEQLSYSDSTIKRYGDYVQMDRPYNRKKEEGKQ